MMHCAPGWQKPRWHDWADRRTKLLFHYSRRLVARIKSTRCSWAMKPSFLTSLDGNSLWEFQRPEEDDWSRPWWISLGPALRRPCSGSPPARGRRYKGTGLLLSTPYSSVQHIWVTKSHGDVTKVGIETEGTHSSYPKWWMMKYDWPLKAFSLSTWIVTKEEENNMIQAHTWWGQLR